MGLEGSDGMLGLNLDQLFAEKLPLLPYNLSSPQNLLYQQLEVSVS